MALTKARLPVIEVSQMDFGTTTVAITSTSGPIDIDIAGLDHVDMTTTTCIFDPLVKVTAVQLDGEVFTMATGAGASATLQTTATEAQLGTTTAHPLQFLADSTLGLTVLTTGQVALGTEGSGVDRLVTKAYVDAATSSGSVALADLVSNNVINGSVQIPNDTGNDLIVNWGVTGSISNTQAAVTFDTAFPNTFFMGSATRQNATASEDSAAHINTPTLSGMNVVNAGGTASTVGWIAIGF
jgi:hypothetical protein